MEDFGFSVREDTAGSFDTDFGGGCGYGRNRTSKKLGYTPVEISSKAVQTTSNENRNSSGDLFNTALGILHSLTSAVLILDSQRRVVFANREAEALLKKGDVISLDSKEQIFCKDHVAQNFLLQYLTSQKMADTSLFNDDEGSFLIPKLDGWPLVAMVGCDQLDALSFSEEECDTEGYVTLMIRDPNARKPEKSGKLMEYFGLSGAESSVVGELVKGSSTDEIARKRSVSVITIRNQLKSAQNKMGVARQSELVSLVLRYVS